MIPLLTLLPSVASVGKSYAKSMLRDRAYGFSPNASTVRRDPVCPPERRADRLGGAGRSVYRDVMPRHYHISADSYYQDPHNDRDVDLAPGTEAYARVLLLANFIQGSGGAVAGAFAAPNCSAWLGAARSAPIQPASRASRGRSARQAG
jgi:hypothetical protein